MRDERKTRGQRKYVDRGDIEKKAMEFGLQSNQLKRFWAIADDPDKYGISRFIGKSLKQRIKAVISVINN